MSNIFHSCLKIIAKIVPDFVNILNSANFTEIHFPHISNIEEKNNHSSITFYSIIHPIYPINLISPIPLFPLFPHYTILTFRWILQSPRFTFLLDKLL